MRSEILYGIHPVVEAISAYRRDIYEVYIEKGKTSRRVKRVLALAESRKIPIVMFPSLSGFKCKYNVFPSESVA